jgi:hypothetical protein
MDFDVRKGCLDYNMRNEAVMVSRMPYMTPWGQTGSFFGLWLLGFSLALPREVARELDK